MREGDVLHDAHSARRRIAYERLVGHLAAEAWVDAEGIDEVVTMDARAHVHRREVERVDAELCELGERATNALEIPPCSATLPWIELPTDPLTSGAKTIDEDRV